MDFGAWVVLFGFIACLGCLVYETWRQFLIGLRGEKPQRMESPNASAPVERKDSPSNSYPESCKLTDPALAHIDTPDRNLRVDIVHPAALVAVMNDGERALLDRLEEIVAGRRVRICPKMRLKDVIPNVISEADHDDLRYALMAHFDLVCLNEDTLRPLAVVELDGKHHMSDPDTIRRDRQKERLCRLARLPLIRVQYGKWHILRDQLRPLLPPPFTQ